MRAVTYWLISVALALFAAGLLFGFIPITVGDTGLTFRGGNLGVSDGVECGSAFRVNGDLTDAGHFACEIQGGAANRRVQAISMIVMGIILFAGGLIAGELAPRHEEMLRRPIQ